MYSTPGAVIEDVIRVPRVDALLRGQVPAERRENASGIAGENERLQHFGVRQEVEQ